MKKIVLVLIAFVFSLQLAFAQTIHRPMAISVTSPSPKPEMQKFDLDFPGGTPQQLVDAIVKQSERPLNAIIPEDYADTQLPALRMRDVTVPTLFEALSAASLKTMGYVWRATYQSKRVTYGFRTNNPGENAVWYFFYEGGEQPPPDPDVCRFYQLDVYLEKYKIEDITTAIKTGWQLLGIKSPPTLKFHPETKLLIAVGHADDLTTVDSVLSQLVLPQKKLEAKKDGEPAKK